MVQEPGRDGEPHLYDLRKEDGSMGLGVWKQSDRLQQNNAGFAGIVCLLRMAKKKRVGWKKY